MSNANHHDLQSLDPQAKLVCFNFTGANGANPSAASFSGPVKTVTRTGEGLYDVVLKTSAQYPAWLAAGPAVVLGAAGDRAFISAFDPDAGTLSLRCYTVADALDDCDAKPIYVWILARNTISPRRA